MTSVWKTLVPQPVVLAAFVALYGLSAFNTYSLVRTARKLTAIRKRVDDLDRQIEKGFLELTKHLDTHLSMINGRIDGLYHLIANIAMNR